jgi:hypothetical protein
MLNLQLNATGALGPMNHVLKYDEFTEGKRVLEKGRALERKGAEKWRALKGGERWMKGRVRKGQRSILCTSVLRTNMLFSE